MPGIYIYNLCVRVCVYEFEYTHASPCPEYSVCFLRMWVAGPIHSVRLAMVFPYLQTFLHCARYTERPLVFHMVFLFCILDHFICLETWCARTHTRRILGAHWRNQMSWNIINVDDVRSKEQVKLMDELVYGAHKNPRIAMRTDQRRNSPTTLQQCTFRQVFFDHSNWDLIFFCVCFFSISCPCLWVLAERVQIYLVSWSERRKYIFSILFVLDVRLYVFISSCCVQWTFVLVFAFCVCPTDGRRRWGLEGS